MSGYAAEGVAAQITADGAAFLGKPFTLAMLARPSRDPRRQRGGGRVRA
jgi:hypothetical protein